MSVKTFAQHTGRFFFFFFNENDVFPFPVISIHNLRNFKVNGNAPTEKPPACCDHLIHEIPETEPEGCHREISPSIIPLSAGSLHQSAGKSFSNTNNKWSVNYEQPHKQGRTAFQLHWVGSRRSQCPIAAKTACWCSHKQLVLPTPSSLSSVAIQSFVWKRQNRDFFLDTNV